jgi:hypothetical protein
MKSHDSEIPYHEQRYPIQVITFGAAFTRGLLCAPVLGYTYEVTSR